MKSFKTFIIESKIRKSYFDSSIPVVILYKTDEEYNIWEPRFKKYGWASDKFLKYCEGSGRAKKQC